MLDKQLWWQIEEDLGIVTDFEVVNQNGNIEIRYKSNGIPKTEYISGNDPKLLIQCLMYCAELVSVNPKYTLVS